ncbi:hypothetical protein ABW19_dt0201745 [Dactylella cylindrospora]|nr:hypothetical protein ABW19_dt0201745 [Dactylella cylindrospora]
MAFESSLLSAGSGSTAWSCASDPDSTCSSLHELDTGGAKDYISKLPTEILAEIVKGTGVNDHTLISQTQKVSKTFRGVVLYLTHGGKIASFPLRLWEGIFEYLDAVSLAKVQLTCSSLNAAVAESKSKRVKGNLFVESLAKSQRVAIHKDDEVQVHPSLSGYLSIRMNGFPQANQEDVGWTETYFRLNSTNPPTDRVVLCHPPFQMANGSAIPMQPITISTRRGPRATEPSRALTTWDILKGAQRMARLPITEAQIYAICGNQEDDAIWDSAMAGNGRGLPSNFGEEELTDVWIGTSFKNDTNLEGFPEMQGELYGDGDGEYSNFRVLGTKDDGTVVMTMDVQ